MLIHVEERANRGLGDRRVNLASSYYTQRTKGGLCSHFVVAAQHAHEVTYLAQNSYLAHNSFVVVPEEWR